MFTPHISKTHALTAACVLLILFLAIYASTYISQQSVLVDLVAQWDYIAVTIIGLISGLNAIIPIPAATLTPLFTAAGLAIPGIIISLVIGTMIADFIGFLLGSSTKGLIEQRYPKLVNFLNDLVTNRRKWLIPFVICYAAFVPFPNEAMLIPLAFSGIGFSRLFIPLLLGNLLNQALLVYGIDSVVSIFG